MPAGVEALLAAGLFLSLGLNLAVLRRQARAERLVQRRSPLRPEPGPPSQAALQQVGLVRFRAYDDTGGDYSFALALLDAGGNGAVVSGLYHRERCRVYAKPVTAWGSSYVLTDEEHEAIAEAKARPA